MQQNEGNNMKPSEQLKKNNLVELEIQLDQALNDKIEYQEKYFAARKEVEEVISEKEEMIAAIKELESKGL